MGFENRYKNLTKPGATTYHSRQHPQQNSDYTPTSCSASYHEQFPNSCTPHPTPPRHYHYDPSDSPRSAATPPTSSPSHRDFSRSVVSPATNSPPPECKARIADRNSPAYLNPSCSRVSSCAWRWNLGWDCGSDFEQGQGVFWRGCLDWPSVLWRRRVSGTGNGSGCWWVGRGILCWGCCFALW